MDEDVFVRKGNLFELYGALLKENQHKAYELHIVEDMSFTEVGEEMNISRQAAQELFRRADERLVFYENSLHLYQKLKHIRDLAISIKEESQEGNIRTLAGEIINGI